MAKHWMVFVNWATIISWKTNVKNAASHGEAHPFQYSSDNVRFLQIKPKDVLWIVSTPRFGARGRPSMHGRARPPAVMARLRVTRICCNRAHERQRIDRDGSKPVCMGSCLPYCNEADLHPASDAWSIVAIGERDPKHPTPLQVTYPVLYNIFGVLNRLQFRTKEGDRDLSDYLAFVEGGQYLSRAQKEAKRSGKQVNDPGPYAPLGQILQTLRQLTPEAAAVMDTLHEQAVSGKRIFFSYKWADVERYAREFGLTRIGWVRELNRELETAGFTSWLDHHQILADRDIGGLLDEVLADAVHQSVVFVALLSENYGTGWTLHEWERACEQLTNAKRKDRLLPIVLNSGGDPKRLGLEVEDMLSVPRAPTPADIVRAIEQGIALRPASNVDHCARDVRR